MRPGGGGGDAADSDDDGYALADLGSMNRRPSFSRSRDAGDDGERFSSEDENDDDDDGDHEDNPRDVPDSSNLDNDNDNDIDIDIDGKSSSTDRLGDGSLDINRHFPGAAAPKGPRKVSFDSPEVVPTASHGRGLESERERERSLSPLSPPPKTNATKRTKQPSPSANAGSGLKQNDGDKRRQSPSLPPSPRQTEGHVGGDKSSSRDGQSVLILPTDATSQQLQHQDEGVQKRYSDIPSESQRIDSNEDKKTNDNNDDMSWKRMAAAVVGHASAKEQQTPGAGKKGGGRSASEPLSSASATNPLSAKDPYAAASYSQHPYPSHGPKDAASGARRYTSDPIPPAHLAVSFDKPYVSNAGNDPTTTAAAAGPGGELRRGRALERACSPPLRNMESRKEKRQRRRMEWRMQHQHNHGNGARRGSSSASDYDVKSRLEQGDSEPEPEPERGRSRKRSPRSIPIPRRQSSLTASTSLPSSSSLSTGGRGTRTGQRSFEPEPVHDNGRDVSVFASKALDDMFRDAGTLDASSTEKAKLVDASTQTDGTGARHSSSCAPKTLVNAAVQTDPTTIAAVPLYDRAVCQSWGKQVYTAPRPWSYQAAISFPQQSLGGDQFISDSGSSPLSGEDEEDEDEEENEEGGYSPSLVMLDGQTSRQTTSSGRTTTTSLIPQYRRHRRQSFGHQIYHHYHQYQQEETTSSSNQISPVPSLPTFRPARRATVTTATTALSPARTPDQNFLTSSSSLSSSPSSPPSVDDSEIIRPTTTGAAAATTAVLQSSVPKLPQLTFPSSSLFPVSISSLPKTAQPPAMPAAAAAAAYHQTQTQSPPSFPGDIEVAAGFRDAKLMRQQQQRQQDKPVIFVGERDYGDNDDDINVVRDRLQEIMSPTAANYLVQTNNDWPPFPHSYIPSSSSSSSSSVRASGNQEETMSRPSSSGALGTDAVYHSTALRSKSSVADVDDIPTTASPRSRHVSLVGSRGDRQPRETSPHPHRLYVDPRPVPVPEPDTPAPAKQHNHHDSSNITSHHNNNNHNNHNNAKTKHRPGFFERMREQASSKPALQQFVPSKWLSKQSKPPMRHAATQKGNEEEEEEEEEGERTIEEEERRRFRADPAGTRPRRSMSMTRRLSQRIRSSRHRPLSERRHSWKVSRSQRRDHNEVGVQQQGEGQVSQQQGSEQQQGGDQQHEPRRRFEILTHSRTLFHKMTSRPRRLSIQNDAAATGAAAVPNLTAANGNQHSTNQDQQDHVRNRLSDLSLEDFGLPYYWQQHETQQQEQQQQSISEGHANQTINASANHINADARNNHNNHANDTPLPPVSTSSALDAVSKTTPTTATAALPPRNHYPNRRAFFLSA